MGFSGAHPGWGGCGELVGVNRVVLVDSSGGKGHPPGLRSHWAQLGQGWSPHFQTPARKIPKSHGSQPEATIRCLAHPSPVPSLNRLTHSRSPSARSRTFPQQHAVEGIAANQRPLYRKPGIGNSQQSPVNDVVEPPFRRNDAGKPRFDLVAAREPRPRFPLNGVRDRSWCLSKRPCFPPRIELLTTSTAVASLWP